MPLNPLQIAGIGLGVGSSLISGLFGGKKPKLPNVSPIATTAEQSGAIQGNISNLAKAENLAAKTNAFNQEQILSLLKTATGGTSTKIIQQSAQNILAGQRGELPPEVQAQIMRDSAAQSARLGILGSRASSSITARDLGLTRLQISNQALQQANQFLQSQNAIGSQGFYNVANQFVTPQERIASATHTRDLQFGRDMQQAGINAAPSPFVNALTGAMSFAGGQLTKLGTFDWLNNRGNTNNQNTSIPLGGLVNATNEVSTQNDAPNFMQFSNYA